MFNVEKQNFSVCLHLYNLLVLWHLNEPKSGLLTAQ